MIKKNHANSRNPTSAKLKKRHLRSPPCRVIHEILVPYGYDLQAIFPQY